MSTKKTVEKMATDEVVALAEQVQEQEDILENIDELGSDYVQDKDSLRKAVNRGKKILQRDQTLIPKTGAQRDAIVKEIKRIEELVIKDMPTVTEMDAKLGSQESHKAVSHNMWFHKKHNANMLRLKDLKRRLDPEDPFSGDLEKIRPR